jgi:hypothetical protein
MAMAGAITGIAGVLSYFGAAFLPLPDAGGRLLGFAIGPLLAVSFLGLFHALATHRDGPTLRFGVVFGILAGCTVTLMLVVQIGNNLFLEQQLAVAETDALRDTARLVHGSVNRVQMLIDVVWDLFICGAGFLIGVSMLRHPAFGRIFGLTGIAASIALLYLNLDTFPRGPAYAGSVDVGPVLAIWFLVVFGRVVWISRKERTVEGT